MVFATIFVPMFGCFRHPWQYPQSHCSPQQINAFPGQHFPCHARICRHFLPFIGHIFGRIFILTILLFPVGSQYFGKLFIVLTELAFSPFLPHLKSSFDLIGKLGIGSGHLVRKIDGK
jgi:hypothetical protein